jgi:hypothetical protein
MARGLTLGFGGDGASSGGALARNDSRHLMSSEGAYVRGDCHHEEGGILH